MHIAPGQGQGQGQTTHWGQNFYVNRKALSLCPLVASFKKIPLNSDFIHIFYTHFFMLLYMYIAGAEANNPLGDKILMSQKHLVTSVIRCKFLPLINFLTFFLKKCIFSHIKE